MSSTTEQRPGKAGKLSRPARLRWKLLLIVAAATIIAELFTLSFGPWATGRIDAVGISACCSNLRALALREARTTSSAKGSAAFTVPLLQPQAGSASAQCPTYRLPYETMQVNCGSALVCAQHIETVVSREYVLFRVVYRLRAIMPALTADGRTATLLQPAAPAVIVRAAWSPYPTHEEAVAAVKEAAEAEHRDMNQTRSAE